MALLNDNNKLAPSKRRYQDNFEHHNEGQVKTQALCRFKRIKTNPYSYVTAALTLFRDNNPSKLNFTYQQRRKKSFSFQYSDFQWWNKTMSGFTIRNINHNLSTYDTFFVQQHSYSFLGKYSASNFKPAAYLGLSFRKNRNSFVRQQMALRHLKTIFGTF